MVELDAVPLVVVVELGRSLVSVADPVACGATCDPHPPRAAATTSAVSALRPPAMISAPPMRLAPPLYAVSQGWTLRIPIRLHARHIQQKSDRAVTGWRKSGTRPQLWRRMGENLPMTDLPTAGDSGWSDPDTLGAIPPVVAITYCAHCGGSASKGSHILCRQRLDVEPPVHCTTCRRTLMIETDGAAWTATCKKHGETTGSLASS